MTKKDWIILRLIFVAIKTNRVEAYNNIDVTRSIHHLVMTYGSKQLNECIMQINREYFK